MFHKNKVLTTNHANITNFNYNNCPPNVHFEKLNVQLSNRSTKKLQIQNNNW